MQFISRKSLVGIIVLIAASSSIGGYAYATTILNHNVQNSHFKGLAGGFTDDTGTWVGGLSAPVPCFGGPITVINAGLAVAAIDSTASGTLSNTPAIFTPFAFNIANATVSNGVKAGDWVQYFFLSNNTDLTPSTTWVLTVIVDQGGAGGNVNVLYFATPASLPGKCYFVSVALELLDFHPYPASTQDLTTPLAWTLSVTKL